MPGELPDPNPLHGLPPTVECFNFPVTDLQTQLVNQNIKLCHFVANREQFIDQQQALSICMGALMDAAIRWDGRIPFPQFAGVTIKYALIAERRKMRRQKRGGGCVILSLDEGVWDLEERPWPEMSGRQDSPLRPRLKSDPIVGTRTLQWLTK